MKPLMIEWAGRTEAGSMRENNEDAFAIAALDETGSRVAEHAGLADGMQERGMVFALADGVGGQNAGEVASALAVSCLAEELARFLESPKPLPSRECGRRLETAVRRVNGRIRQEAAADPAKKDMAATLSCLWIVGHRGFFAQVGDSRLYRYRGDELAQLSHDQSEVGRAVRSGRISEADGKLTLGRNLLDQALGLRDETLAPEIDWIEVLPGDVYLLCSDGLVDRLHDSDLARCMGESLARGEPLTACADTLLHKAEESKSRDNVTVLLVRARETSEGRDPASATVCTPSTDTCRTPLTTSDPNRRRITLPALLLTLFLGLAIGTITGYLLASTP